MKQDPIRAGNAACRLDQHVRETVRDMRRRISAGAFAGFDAVFKSELIPARSYPMEAAGTVLADRHSRP